MLARVKKVRSKSGILQVERILSVVKCHQGVRTKGWRGEGAKERRAPHTSARRPIASENPDPRSTLFNCHTTSADVNTPNTSNNPHPASKY